MRQNGEYYWKLAKNGAKKAYRRHVPGYGVELQSAFELPDQDQE
jgi:hypothetical protein